MAFRDENTRNSPQSRRYARLVAPIIERIDSGCASNPMRVLIRLTAPFASIHASFHNLFNSQSSLSKRSTSKLNRDAALTEWRSLVTSKNIASNEY